MSRDPGPDTEVGWNRVDARANPDGELLLCTGLAYQRAPRCYVARDTGIVAEYSSTVAVASGCVTVNALVDKLCNNVEAMRVPSRALICSAPFGTATH